MSKLRLAETGRISFPPPKEKEPPIREYTVLLQMMKRV
jgi:hypothetical protein